MVMDDAEVEVQNDMFKSIMDICGGHPNRRVLQVLTDTLACVAVNVGEPIEDVVDGLKLSFSDAQPKDRKEPC